MPAHADMAGPSALPLLLLLTSAVAAVQYRWLDAVSLPGPAVQNVSAGSEIGCALHCEGMADGKCSGFVYEPGAGTCRLFSGDCRGPADNNSEQNTERYMAKNGCTGENLGSHRHVFPYQHPVLFLSPHCTYDIII